MVEDADGWPRERAWGRVISDNGSRATLAVGITRASRGDGRVFRPVRARQFHPACRRLENPLALTDWKDVLRRCRRTRPHDANALASKVPPAPKTSAAATH